MSDYSAGIREDLSDVSGYSYINRSGELRSSTPEEARLIHKEIIEKITSGRIYGSDSIFYDYDYKITNSDKINYVCGDSIFDPIREDDHIWLTKLLELAAIRVESSSLVNNMLIKSGAKAQSPVRLNVDASSDNEKIAIVFSCPSMTFHTKMRDRFYMPPEFYTTSQTAFPPETSVREVIKNLQALVTNATTSFEREILKVIDNTEYCRDNKFDRIFVGTNAIEELGDYDPNTSLQSIMSGCLGTKDDIPIFTDAFRSPEARVLDKNAFLKLPMPEVLGMFSDRDGPIMKLAGIAGSREDDYKTGIPKSKLLDNTEFFLAYLRSAVIFLNAKTPIFKDDLYPIMQKLQA